MIKAPIGLQDLRRRLYVKAKTEGSGRHKRLGFSGKRWSREWQYGTLGPEYRVSAAVKLCSRSRLIGPITLAVKCAGARSAGNPHATCDAAGAGNGVTAIPKRARRGKPRTRPRRSLRATAAER